MKHILIIIFLLSAILTTAQEVEILSEGHFKPKKKVKGFAFLEARTDTTQLQFVATIKITDEDRKTSIANSFYRIERLARSLGANCFRLKTFSRDSTNTALIFDTYFAGDSLLSTNQMNHEKNIVYIFFGDRLDGKKCSLTVNGEKKEFISGTYLKLHLKEGEELNLNKGGLTGATANINYAENKPPIFFTITDAGIGGGPMPPGTVGVSVHTGRFNDIYPDFGLLLAQVLKLFEKNK